MAKTYFYSASRASSNGQIHSFDGFVTDGLDCAAEVGLFKVMEIVRAQILNEFGDANYTLHAFNRVD